MSQNSQPDTPSGFFKLPIDVLLNIFNNCDVVDILSLGLTCKQLCTATEERHVWLTQFKRHCTPFRQAPFHYRTKQLHVHSTAQLRSWTIQQARMDALWLRNGNTDNNLKLQSVCTNDPVDYTGAFLLPGGEHLVAVTGYDIILKKIERRNDIEDSECVLSNLACYSLREQEASCADVFTDTSCEYPLIAYHNWKDPSITMFRLDHDSRTISVQREIRINPRYKPVDYGMEYLGIRGDTIMWFYNDYDGESREHLILARLDDPDCSATRYLDLGTSRVSRFEVINANAFIRYNSGGIYLYHIPHLPPGIQSQDGNGKRQTPSVVWSSHDSCAPGPYGGLYYDRTDAVLPKLHLHNDEHSHIIEFGMDTLTDAKNDPCVGYPVVLNHTITPANEDPNDRTSSRWWKGRRGAHFDSASVDGEFCLRTLLVDDPNRRGYFRGSLGWYESPEDWWIERLEQDDVTGRILLVIYVLPGARELFFVDPLQP